MDAAKPAAPAAAVLIKNLRLFSMGFPNHDTSSGACQRDANLKSRPVG